MSEDIYREKDRGEEGWKKEGREKGHIEVSILSIPYPSSVKNEVEVQFLKVHKIK